MFGFVSARRYETVRARNERLHKQLADAREDARGARGVVRQVAAQYTAVVDGATGTTQRLERLARAVGRARAEAARERRRADHLQQRLDDAVGLTTPAIDAGATWQSRRPDTTKESTS